MPVNTSVRGWPGWFRVALLVALAYAVILVMIASQAAHVEWAASGPPGALVAWLRLYANLPAAWFGRLIGHQSFTAFLVGQVLEVAIVFGIAAFFAQFVPPRIILQSRVMMILLVLVLGAVVASGEYYYYGPYEGRCAHFEQSWTRDQCLSAMGVHRVDLSACAGDAMCMLNMAWSSKDESICPSITDTDLAATCEAWLKGDESLCQNVADSRTQGTKLVAGYRSLCMQGIEMHSKRAY